MCASIRRRGRVFRVVLVMLFGLPGLAAETASAMETLVEGCALVGRDGLAAAREVATRRALARAAELGSTRVSAQSLVREGQMFETTQVGASACTQDAHVLDERVDSDELVIRLRAQVSTCEAQREPETDAASCERAYLNRLLVTGFAFEFPEQLLEEWGGRLLPLVNRQGIEALTAMELAHALERSGRVLAGFDGSAFPYASPSRAPTPHLPIGSLDTPFAALARGRQAQYVLAGVYREFGLNRNWGRHERQIEIEAFVHDGVNGAVLARRRFQTKVAGSAWSGAAIFPNRPTICTRAFQATPFGRAWTELIEDIARWAAGQVSCFLFVARVVKVDGHMLQIDASAESRMNPGDTMTLHLVRPPPPVVDLSERFLGREKFVRATVLLRAVYPTFSIAELIEAPDGLQINPGDLIYAQ
ncbi:MAG: hypothetical protein LBF93_11985 [Zoogloeaceae bacterium]|jgi:hypothetical protein|nr:hypothetical protein [Zoogloeaceae bacterium]